MDGIYTSNILIAVNPFFPVPQLYSQDSPREKRTGRGFASSTQKGWGAAAPPPRP